MKLKIRVLALFLIAVMMFGMTSCMNNIPCPAYASTTQKSQNNKG